MKVWKVHLVSTILLALAGVLFLVPVVKQLIEGEPVNVTSLVAAGLFLIAASVFLVVAVVVRRKSGGGSGPPSA
ncbi:MAG: hypothetical protein SH850_04900 [Planctomycetaceae bacterium]|nr:hypothetical protein [Planctomycetaceae bacterium]